MSSDAEETADQALRRLLATSATRDLLLALYAEASLGRTIASLVHQLRNPLNSILNGAQLMEEREASEALQAKLLPVILRSGQRAGELLDALDQHREPGHTRLDLRAMTRECLHLLRDQTMNVEVKGLDGPPILVHGQRHELYPMVLSVLQSHLVCRPSALLLAWDGDAKRCELCVNNVGGSPLAGTGSADFLLQESLASCLGGSLHRHLSAARSTLRLASGTL